MNVPLRRESVIKKKQGFLFIITKPIFSGHSQKKVSPKVIVYISSSEYFLVFSTYDKKFTGHHMNKGERRGKEKYYKV